MNLNNAGKPAGNKVGYIFIGIIIIAIIVMLFLIFGREKFPVSPEEEEFYRGKTPEERLLVPQQIDENIFKQ